jgi:hypothetical protein
MSRNRSFILFLVMVSFSSIGSPPIESILLNDEIAKDLGFSIDVETDNDATILNLSGPLEINGCTAQRVGNFITESGKDISGYLGTISQFNSPSSFGYIRNGEGLKMLVFIDYICPDGRNSESRRYELWSTRT